MHIDRRKPAGGLEVGEDRDFTAEAIEIIEGEGHARFVRDGNDIISSVDLTMSQAALGTNASVPTLDGDVDLEFKPGTQPGEVRVLRGKGMPVLQGFGRGDHRLLVNVAVPRNLSDEQRRLLEEFARAEHEANYKAEEGFFDKIRAAFR